MKRSCFIFLLLCLNIQNLRAVSQRLVFNCKGAEEVYIVWGIEHWQLLPEEKIPAGSFVKDKLVYTLMTRESTGEFSVVLDLPPGTTLDYVFWITQGPLGYGTDIWDSNIAPQKDYHTIVTQGSEVKILSKLVVHPAQPLSLLKFAYYILALFLFLFFCFRSLLKRQLNNQAPKNIWPLFAGPAMSLIVFLLLVRPSTAGFSWDLVIDPMDQFLRVLWAGYYDVIYVGVITCLFYFPAVMLRDHPRIQRAVIFAYFSFCLISLIAGIANIQVVQALGKPFNYQWLYYSNFLKSADAQAAISANLSADQVGRTIAICVAAAVGAHILFLLMTRVQLIAKKRIFLGSAVILMTGYCFAANSHVKEENWNYDQLSNPVAEFMASVNPFAPDPELFTADVDEEFAYRKPVAQNEKPRPVSSGIRNVVLFVLESTPAEYVDPYGSIYKATPCLQRLSSQAITFQNVYAHAPATNLSMVSMLSSTYPWLSYNSFTEEFPGIKMQSIVSELKSKGYRAAFFNSADNRYQKAGEFLQARGFDRVSDCRDETCGKQKFVVENKDWKFMDGKDDACNANDMLSWINSGDERPFFGMAWTYQTHYPYFFEGAQKSYPTADSSFNRYLNALHYADSLIGEVAADLQKSGLSESTLLVVVGDHGEAFGRHGQISHGRMIYEENLHVPCLFIHPSFKGQQVNSIGGMVDIAPTVLQLLGQEAPREWEGISLLEESRDQRTFFFAPWSDFLFGYRENNFKYIFNATHNRWEVYDLEKDPFEQNDLAHTSGSKIDEARQRLASWAQHVNRATNELIAGKTH